MKPYQETARHIIKLTAHTKTATHHILATSTLIHVYVANSLIWVHEMHGRINPTD